MRQASRDDWAEQRSHLADPDHEALSTEDKTTAVSVATLRRLAERSSEDPPDEPREPRARPSPPPEFFSKSGAILVEEPAPEPSHSESSESPSQSESIERSSVERSSVELTAPPSAPSHAALVTTPPPRTAHRSNASYPPYRVPKSSGSARWLVVVSALLAFVAVALVWRHDLRVVRDKVIAAAPTWSVLVSWSKTILPK